MTKIDKHTSLPRSGINYERKKFYGTASENLWDRIRKTLFSSQLNEANKLVLLH